MTHAASTIETMRVVVCDDSGIFRQGLCLLLQAAGIEVVGSVADTAELYLTAAVQQPDLAVVDIRLPPTYTDEGIRAALDLHRNRPGMGVLVLSTYVEARFALMLLDGFATGIGYLLKDRVEDIESLVAAMRRIAGGGIVLDPEVVSRLVSARRHGSRLDRITEREREVLSLLAEGQSNADIARSLRLAVKTVEMHVASVFRALDLDALDGGNRRVKAAIAFLSAQHEGW